MVTLLFKSGVLTWRIWLSLYLATTYVDCLLTGVCEGRGAGNLGKGSPGPNQDKLQCWQHVHCHNNSGSLLKKNSGGTLHATPTHGHLSFEKQNLNAQIKSEHTHAITHRKTNALIEYIRDNTQWFPNDYNTPESQTKKKNRYTSQPLFNVLVWWFFQKSFIYTLVFHDVPKFVTDTVYQLRV